MNKASDFRKAQKIDTNTVVVDQNRFETVVSAVSEKFNNIIKKNGLDNKIDIIDILDRCRNAGNGNYKIFPYDELLENLAQTTPLEEMALVEIANTISPDNKEILILSSQYNIRMIRKHPYSRINGESESLELKFEERERVSAEPTEKDI